MAALIAESASVRSFRGSRHASFENSKSLLRKPKGGVQVTFGSSQGAIEKISSVPQKHHKKGNWQTKVEGVLARTAALFNCHTMSDVTLIVEGEEIPAHKFVLGSASGLLYRQLYEEKEDSNLSLQVWNGSKECLYIKDVTLPVWVQFMSFLYRDEADITLDNVVQMLKLAERYEVAGLCDRCFEFLRAVIAPDSVLRVLEILKICTVKAIMISWQEVVAQAKATRRFRELSLMQRRNALDELHDHSGANSRSTSRCSQGSSRDRAPPPRRRSFQRASDFSLGGFSHGGRSESYGADGQAAGEKQELDDDINHYLDIAQGYRKKKMKFETGTEQLTRAFLRFPKEFAEDIRRKCWRCIQEQTEAVICTGDMWRAEVKMLRQIMGLERLSAPEFLLFRACSTWAEKQCARNGVAATVENMRHFLGEETLRLIRFPVMTPEEFKWEVIPTGLLDYEDVKLIMEQKISKYETQPREPGVRGEKPKLDEAQMQWRDGKAFYGAVPGDPIDQLLANELLHVFLMKQIADASDEPVGAGKKQRKKQGLPPISPRTAHPPPVTHRGGRLVTPRRVWRETHHDHGAGAAITMALTRVSSQMVMGTWGEEEGEQAPEGPPPKARVANPDDFERLAQGLYRFRGDRLLEMWIEKGNAQVLDHGVKANLKDIPRNGSEDVARKILGLGQVPPSGHGVPLMSFLCSN